jgi:predicted DNA-binding transcriptional regulator AlpA
MSRPRSILPAPALPRPLLTADAVAELLAVTRSAIYARHARGAIPGGVRFGRTLRFDPDIIAAWIAAHTDRRGAP